MAQENSLVATLKVENIRGLGVLRYSIDADGIIQFKAYPKGEEDSGNVTEIKITQDRLNMSNEEIIRSRINAINTQKPVPTVIYEKTPEEWRV